MTPEEAKNHLKMILADIRRICDEFDAHPYMPELEMYFGLIQDVIDERVAEKLK